MYLEEGSSSCRKLTSLFTIGASLEDSPRSSRLLKIGLDTIFIKYGSWFKDLSSYGSNPNRFRNRNRGYTPMLHLILSRLGQPNKNRCCDAQRWIRYYQTNRSDKEQELVERINELVSNKCLNTTSHMQKETIVQLYEK